MLTEPFIPIHAQSLPEIIFVVNGAETSKTFKEAFVLQFNRFLHSQQMLALPAHITVAFFKTHLQFVHESTPLHSASPIYEEYFSYNARTALLDGIGLTLKAFKKRLKHQEVVMAIFTNEDENGSWAFTTKRIIKMINKRQTKRAWQIFLLTSNQQTLLTGLNLGIDPRRCLFIDEASHGISRAFDVLEYACLVTRGYHKTLSVHSFFYQQIDFNTLSSRSIKQAIQAIKAAQHPSV